MELPKELFSNFHVEQHGTITCVLGDCEEVMRLFPDKFFELAIIDPPYGINISTNIGRRKGDKKSNYRKFEGGDKTIPNKQYFEELHNISVNQIIWGGNYMTEHLRPSPCWLMYDKMFSEDVSFAQYELAWTSFSTSSKKFTMHPSSIKGRIHPTEKPIKLYEWLLTNYAKKGDKILDTHGGSFSHAIACHNLGFELLIIEKDEYYFKAAVERLKWHQRQLSLFETI